MTTIIIRSAENRNIVWPAAATVRDLFSEVTVAPGARTQWQFNPRIGITAQALQTVIADSDTQDSDTSNSFNVSAGTRTHYFCQPTSSPNVADAYWSCSYQFDTNHRFAIFGNQTKTQVGGTDYIYPSNRNDTPNGTEAQHRNLMSKCRLERIQVRYTANIGTGNTGTTTVMVNGVASSLVHVQSGGAGGGTDGFVDIDDFDEISVEHVFVVGGSAPFSLGMEFTILCRAYLFAVGQADGQSAVTGAIKRRRLVSGAADASSAMTGTLKRRRLVASIVSTSSSVSATLARRLNVTGQLDAQSAVSAMPTVLAKVFGSVNGVSTVSGLAVAVANAGGVISSQSSLQARLSATCKASGQIDALAATSAVLTGNCRVSGTVAAVLAVSGSILLKRTVQGQSDAQSAVSGLLTRTTRMTVLVESFSDLSAYLTERQGLLGTVPGVSFLSASLTVQDGTTSIAGEVEAMVSVFARLVNLCRISGQIDAVSGLRGFCGPFGPLIAFCPTKSVSGLQVYDIPSFILMKNPKLHAPDYPELQVADNPVFEPGASVGAMRVLNMPAFESDVPPELILSAAAALETGMSPESLTIEALQNGFIC